jgi:hypothetical protein
MLNQHSKSSTKLDSHLPVQTNSDHAKPFHPAQPRLNKSQTQLPASGNQNLLKSQTKFAVKVSAQETKLEAYVSGQ